MAPIRRAAPRPDFASHPSDLELINTYLIPWVNTGERPWSFIHDADVYAAKPQDLARNFAPATASDGLEGWYFFSTLRSKNRRGQRKSRTVGSEGDDGCWHSERAAKPLFAGINHSRQIGYRQTFSFATKGDGRLLRSGWLMAEIGLNSDGSEDDELVLCKVYRSPRGGPAKRSTAAAATTEATGPRVGRGKPSAPSQQGRPGPAHLPQPAPVSASSSGTLSMESDSEQDSTSQGGGGIGTSPSATPPRRPSPRLIAPPNPRSEALPATQQISFLPSSPVRRTSAAPGAVAAAAAPRPDFACHPSDQALVQSYLIPRIASGQHPCKFTHDADVYAAGPDALTTQFPPAISGDGEKAWYIFTTLPAKSTHGQRRPRTVATGEGCWHSEAGVKPVVVDGDHQIGWRQFFSFMTKDAGRSTRTGWIMVEIGLEQQEGLTDELVLCKVYRSPRKGPAPTALESTAPAASGRSKRRRVDDNNSGAALTLGTAPKESTATTPPSGRKKRKTTGDSSPGARGPARGVLKLTTPPTSGRNKQGDKKKARLCTRCRIETAESDSGTSEDDDTEDDETRGGSGTGLLEHDSITDESAAPHGHEAGDSSASARTFYRFV
ncbi:hypothetical protein QYE76_017774 [Lolium multiflorum]|uniref:NAC domain-containing protein n=1 Tax=Lolium multiflorum TaxID=4521 RepID=A0AAD8QH38_LOLMU|nr:hypothetical protein QYE76_008260 [Lolium multiflorum]KAK1601392.1 hypothetical protein QYE76_017774 [Lolium multiflorum]